MPSFRIRVNGKTVLVESWDPDQPLLYILRNSLGLRTSEPSIDTKIVDRIMALARNVRQD